MPAGVLSAGKRRCELLGTQAFGEEQDCCDWNAGVATGVNRRLHLECDATELPFV